MPQDLPKKIEVALLLSDLALELGNPLPRLCPIVEKRAAQGRPIQPARPRPARAPKPLQAAAPSQLLPLV